MKKFTFHIFVIFCISIQSYAQWNRLNFPTEVQVNSIVVNDSYIFAGTNGKGIFVSTDNGDNWSEVNNGLISKVIFTLIANNNIIYAGTETGAYMSSNNGINWNSISNGLSNEGVWSLTISNQSLGSQKIFAGTWSGVYSSTDDGKSWKPTSLTTLVPVNSIVAIDNYIYASTIGGGFYESNNYGVSWRNISFWEYQQIDSPFGPSMNGDKIAVKPVYSLGKIGTTAVVSVGYGFICYKPLGKASFLNPVSDRKANAPIRSFTSLNNIVFAGSQFGEIIITENGGSIWSSFSQQLWNHALYSLASNNSYLFAGIENGVMRLPFTSNEATPNLAVDSPSNCSLAQNYPNPFNPSTIINWEITKGSNVSLRVFDILGREIASLVNEYKNAGVYQNQFSIEDFDLLPGVYFYQLKAENFTQTKKMIVIK